MRPPDRPWWPTAGRLGAALLLLAVAVVAVVDRAEAQPAPSSTPPTTTLPSAPPSTAPSTPPPATADEPDCSVKPLLPGACEWPPDGPPPGQRPPPTGPVVELPMPEPATPGLFDVPGQVRKAVNDWFADLVASGLRPVLDLLARTLLATPALTDPGGRVAELWRTSVVVVDGLYALLLVLGGVLVMTHETIQTRYALKDIAPRAILGLLAVHLSLPVTGWGIQAANALSRALLGQQVAPEHIRDTLTVLLVGPADAGGVFFGLLQLAVLVVALVLVGTYIVRLVVLTFLIPAGPLMLAAHALPPIEGLARLWWRGLGACLAIQVGQALVLSIAVRVFFQADRARVLGVGSSHLIDLVVVFALLWLLLRIPIWATKTAFNPQRSAVVRTVRSIVLVRLLRRRLGSPL